MNQETHKSTRKLKKPVVKIDERLNKFMGVDLFPEKTARANKYGAAIQIKDKIR